jgi:2-polyprenyl-6-methoxyphenol hydroxylase-like FAD-dependent oxidoreductase
MKIMIAGAGIAGLSLAYWLAEKGQNVTLIEKAPALEQEGFLIGFRGISVTILQRMGLLDKALSMAMDSIHHDILSSKGQKINRSLYLSYKEHEAGKLPMNRADLHRLLYEAVKDKVEICFGTRIQAIEQKETVEIILNNGQAEEADLLIGADGVHSSVRKMVFGEGFEQDLNASYAAFISPKHQAIQSAVQFAKGRMSVLYDLNEGEFGGIFVLKGHEFAALPREQQKAALIQAHQGSSIAEDLSQLSPETAIFTDKLIQIAMPSWVSGKVALVGDAAYCLSPASGFGATAAIAGAYVLAEAINGRGLGAYEKEMRPAIEKKRKSSAAVVNQIVSENPIMIGIRDFLLRMMPEKATYKAKKVDDFGIAV